MCAQSCPTLCNPMDCSPPGCSVHGIFPGKNTGVDCHFLLQGTFPTQGLNPCLLHWQADSLHWATWESLNVDDIVLYWRRCHLGLSQPYMTTGKTIALTRRTFVDLLIRFAVLYERGSPCLKTMSKITDRRSTTKNIIITKKSGASLVAL